MTDWGKIAAKNLIPKSLSDVLAAALAEWHFDGQIIDHGEAEEVCELCEHEGLRWHFGIVNDLTGNTLMVGSTCILAFEGIRVYDPDDGELATGDVRRLVLNRQRDRMVREKERADREAAEAIASKQRLYDMQARIVRNEVIRRTVMERFKMHQQAELDRFRLLWKADRDPKHRDFIERYATSIRDGHRLTDKQHGFMRDLLGQYGL